MLALCVGMYRACSTWQYGVVGSILERHREGRRLGFVEGIYFREKLDPPFDDSGWAVLKAHDAHERFAEILSTRKAVGFYAYRDLRDVVLSYMHKTGTDFDSLMERGFVELCLNNDRFWRAQPGMLIQNYDDLIAHPARGVGQVADHLGVTLEAGEAESIAEGMSWESNRRKVETLAERLRGEGATPSPDDQSRFDPVSLLHWNHIRPTSPPGASKGGTPRQRGLIEQVCRPWLVAHGFESSGTAPLPGEESVARTSYAPSRVDVRLDRLFRGSKSILIDFDAPLPRVANPSYYLYLRGWRSVNVGTTAAPRDRFVVERPTDLNLTFRFDSPEDLDGPARSDSEALAGLIDSHRVPPPELVVFNPASDVDRLLGAILTTPYRPKIFVVDSPRSVDEAPVWPSMLDQFGYLAVPDLEGPGIYVRADLAESVAILARPLGPHDHYRPAEWTAADLEALSEAEIKAASLEDPPNPERAVHLAGEVGEYSISTADAIRFESSDSRHCRGFKPRRGRGGTRSSRRASTVELPPWRASSGTGC